MKKTYYIATDTAYGSDDPICVDWFEAERLMNEWYDSDDAPAFDEVWREASQSEIEQYGTYASGVSDRVFSTLWSEALNTNDRDAFISDWSLSTIWHEVQGLSRNAELSILADIASRIWDAAHTSIRDIVAHTGLTQAAFAVRYCIPLRTVENWCRDVSKCPDYTRLMMLRLLGLV